MKFNYSKLYSKNLAPAPTSFSAQKSLPIADAPQPTQKYLPPQQNFAPAAAPAPVFVPAAAPVPVFAPSPAPVFAPSPAPVFAPATFSAQASLPIQSQPEPAATFSEEDGYNYKKPSSAF